MIVNSTALTSWLDDIATEGVVPAECTAIYLGIFGFDDGDLTHLADT